MTDKTWKAYERRLAVRLGTHRIPVTGERDGADFENGMFCYQAKKRKTYPGYVGDWLQRIRAKAKERQKIGVVVLQAPGGADDDSLVILAFKDWVDLHG